MTAAGMSLAVLAAGALTACLALHRWGWRGSPLALGAVALAPALGYGPLSLATFAWSWSGRGGGRPALLALALGVAAALIGLTPRHQRKAARRREPLPRSVALTVAGAGMLALAAIAVASPFLMRARPTGLYDAHAIWNTHALFLSRAESDPPQLFRAMRLGHPDYPLFVPGAVAGQWSLLGWEAVRVPHVTGAVFLLATALVIGTALAARDRPVAGCLAMALYLSTPSALHWGFGQCADVPLSYLLTLAAVGCAGLVGREEDAPLPPSVAGFALGLLAWTKNEGMLLAALVLSAAMVVMLWRMWGGASVNARTWSVVGLGAAAPLLALVLFKLYWSPRSELGMYLGRSGAGVADPTRWATVAIAFLREIDPLGGWRRWGAVWPFALTGCAWGARSLLARRDPVRAALGLTLAGGLAMYLFVYVAGSGFLEWQLSRSLDRLLLQLLPLALICGLDWPNTNADFGLRLEGGAPSPAPGGGGGGETAPPPPRRPPRAALQIIDPRVPADRARDVVARPTPGTGVTSPSR